MEVPRRSRVSLALHVIVPDHDVLAFHVHARIGRLVAEQSIDTDGTNGPAGLTTTLGAAAPATTWRFPTLDAQSGTAATLSIANFANAGTKATLGYTLDQHATLPANAPHRPVDGHHREPGRPARPAERRVGADLAGARGRSDRRRRHRDLGVPRVGDGNRPPPSAPRSPPAAGRSPPGASTPPTRRRSSR